MLDRTWNGRTSTVYGETSSYKIFYKILASKQIETNG